MGDLLELNGFLLLQDFVAATRFSAGCGRSTGGAAPTPRLCSAQGWGKVGSFGAIRSSATLRADLAMICASLGNVAFNRDHDFFGSVRRV